MTDKIQRSLESLFSSSKSKSMSCFGSEPANNENEPTYIGFKRDVEVKILMGFNFVIVAISLTVAIIGILKGDEVPLRVSAFFVSFIALFVKLLSIKLWKLMVIVSWTMLIYILAHFSEYYAESDPPGCYFLLGNALGMAEFLIILSLKNLFLKIGFIAVNCAVKLAVFDGHFNTESLVLFSVILAVCVAFYIFYDFLERRNFKAFCKSREELRKFQLLLSKDFPTSVMVISSDLKSSLYSNDFFKSKFDQETTPILSFFNKFKIDSEFQIDENDNSNNDKPNLSDVMAQFSAETDVSKQKEGETLFASFEKTPQEKFYFEIRLRRIIWDMKPAYALIFNDTSDKQILMTMKYAEQLKDRIIQTLSHELKTPINGILGLVRIVKARINDQVSLTYLEYSESCSNLLLNFVNSILELSQLKQGKQKINKDPFDLNEFLKEVRSLFLFQAEQRNIDFSVEKDPLVPDTLFTDKHRLTMILITLLGNAFKFTFKGSVALKLKLDENDANKLAFSIADTGEGIKDEDKEAICKIFGHTNRKSANDRSHGVGFGLTVSNELVKALNDYSDNAVLKFESEYKKGTTFYFNIKIDSELHSNIITETNEESQSIALKITEIDEIATDTDLVSNKILTVQSYKDTYHFLDIHSINNLNSIMNVEKNVPKHVLVVDDNPFNILAVSFILEKLKCKVTKANNGEECLHVLAESVAKDEHFDLILMDIQMPILDGVEATKIIQTRIKEGSTYPVPIVALTANKLDSAERERYLDSGMVDSLSKPLQESELIRVMAEAGING